MVLPRVVLMCGTFAALLGCAEARTTSSEPAAPLTPDSGPRLLDAAMMDATAPRPTDASFPVSPDASPPSRLDGSVDAADPMSDAAADARAPFLGEARLDVLTKPAGRYQPHNLLAIWIEDEAGTPVKVIGRWAGVFQRYLTTFNRRAPGAFGGLFGFPLDGSIPIGELDPDVITTPTLRVHEQHELTWDLTDYAGMPVPDATYFIYLESNDDNFESSVTVIELHKGPEPTTVEQGESERFAHVRVSYTPREP